MYVQNVTLNTTFFQNFLYLYLCVRKQHPNLTFTVDIRNSMFPPPSKAVGLFQSKTPNLFTVSSTSHKKKQKQKKTRKISFRIRPSFELRGGFKVVCDTGGIYIKSV